MYITQPSIQFTERHMQSTYSGKAEKAMQHEERNVSKKNKKKFLDMNIEERLEYFLSQPFYAPKVKCEIRTDQRKFVGYIQSIEENSVELLLPGRKKEITVQLDEIEEVNLFGF